MNSYVIGSKTSSLIIVTIGQDDTKRIRDLWQCRRCAGAAHLLCPPERARQTDSGGSQHRRRAAGPTVPRTRLYRRARPYRKLDARPDRVRTVGGGAWDRRDGVRSARDRQCSWRRGRMVYGRKRLAVTVQIPLWGALLR